MPRATKRMDPEKMFRKKVRPKKVEPKPLTKEEERIWTQFTRRIAIAEERAKEFTSDDLKEYIKYRIDHDLVPKNFNRFIARVLSKATKGVRTVRPGGFMTLDKFVELALDTAKRKGKPKEPRIDVKAVAKEMVATRIPGVPKLTEEAVTAALELAALIEVYSRKRNIEDFNLKNQFVGRKVV